MVNEEKSIDVKEEIQDILSFIQGDCSGINIFNEMIKFSRWMKENFDFNKDIQYSIDNLGKMLTPTHVNSVRIFIEIARMRNMFSLCLEYMNKQRTSIRLEQISNGFRQMYSEWKLW